MILTSRIDSGRIALHKPDGIDRNDQQEPGVAISGGFFIDVDASGDVTSQNTDVATATGSGTRLTFNSTLILVEPENLIRRERDKGGNGQVFWQGLY